MASPHFRRQDSLEGILDFSLPPLSDPGDRANAERRFYQIINHFRSEDHGQDTYDRVELVSSTYEYSTDEISKGRILNTFFQFAKLPTISGENINFDDPTYTDTLRTSLNTFADHLFNSFFLPLKASTIPTPEQPTPASRTAIMQMQPNHTFAGTTDRIKNLRGTCLLRDRSRKRFKLERRGQGTAFDDDGQPLAGQRCKYLEVAHILPHSLTQVGSDKKLNESKQAALNILRMFSDGAAYLIDGANIDCPQNALTLSVELHRLFGDFEIFFQPDDTVRYQYHIRTFAQEAIDDIPITRTLTGESNIDLPSPQLLAIHCAIAHILHLSGAGDYIDRILRDADDYGIRRDGSTELCCLLELRLNNWVGRQADRGSAFHFYIDYG
ncbi:hypothetical protein FPSE_03218 [Fusarium pseudograminearum CS3096]|uniref:HNH nuclease domain-containing protein n=1 Tax=Fusarium pseudograminearum (strain CS3096) TaxID=1028729 RepID=K3VRP8_FUSPC|nr:hypothetical protein FPSE_03218 [Fusarium pseudograminearum CS3096]EKJ76668.1 hypothetical protein FPSE_03218 [Fusarium pseudograminearum CS3096]